MPASAWARERAEAVCADSRVWNDGLVERMALALDEAEQRGRAAATALWVESAAPPVAPPEASDPSDPSDPLVQAVLDAAETWADSESMSDQSVDVLLGLGLITEEGAELQRQVAALRSSRKGEQGG